MPSRPRTTRYQLVAWLIPGLVLLLIASWAQEPQSRFSHKTHAPLKLTCVQCHSGAREGERARFPGRAACLVCHPGMPATATTFPSRRAFALPDFVYFSHKLHLAAKAECAKCHGDVAATHQVNNELEMKMKFCVDCHTETKAPVDCFVCHELGQ